MSTRELKDLLERVEDTREIVLGPATPGAEDELMLGELYAVWTAARSDAVAAYDVWCAAPGAEAYAVYVAARDRADAAQDALQAHDTAGAR